jgi:putative transposase
MTRAEEFEQLRPLLFSTDDADRGAVRAGAESLEVQIARDLLERARTESVSLVRPGGLLAEVTKTVLQAALDAEMADQLG